MSEQSEQPSIEGAPGAGRLLLVEDDADFRAAAQRSLNLAGFRVFAFADAESALQAFGRVAPELVLTDLRLPGADGMFVMQQAKLKDADVPVIIMTGHGDIPTAIQAIRDGAYDFLEKPFGRERMLSQVTRAVGQYRVMAENRHLKSRLAASSGIDQILLGDSAAMRELRDLLLRLAPTSVDVLVKGETGTGKELVARCLHTFGKRPGHFVAVNCAAVPENLFESELFGHEAGAFTGAGKQRIGKVEYANNGTLFLDEIEAMPMNLQAKVLRVLQEREVERLGSNKSIAVNFRVVAATKVDLEGLCKKGLFRDDLYYRINVATVEMLSLRDRVGDILALFNMLLERASLRHNMPVPKLSIEEQQRLLSYQWPGNVRELGSCADRRVVGLPILMDAKDGGSRRQTLQQAVDMVESSLIEQALRRHGGSVKQACADLALTSATIYRKMKALGIDANDYRGGGCGGSVSDEKPS